MVPMIAARGHRAGEPGSFQLAGILLLIFGLTALLARNYRARCRSADRAEGAGRAAGRATARRKGGRRGGAARGRGGEPREDAVLRRRQPRPAPAAARAGPVRRGAAPAAATTTRWSQLVNSINELGRRARGPVLRAARHHADRHRRRRAAAAADFQVGDIFRKLRLHFEPIAFEKGLALRLRGGQHHAYADPLLVERILRNLVSNAIRYTTDGGVLVSCRARAATGCCCRCGTPAWASSEAEQRAHLRRVLPGARQRRTLEPHQRKGLGLGLAIVKRLAGLMNAPLALRSEPGHGSVFTLELPVGRRRGPTARCRRARRPLGITLDAAADRRSSRTI